MSFAPFRAVLKASREGALGDLNPTPWVFMLGNCVGWLAYSFMTLNVYVFLPNVSGFILAIWLNIQAIKLQYENHRSEELQTAIINALEDLDRSTKHKKLSKQEVTNIVEHVITEETPTVEMIDPMTTAPILEIETSEEEANTDVTRSTTYSSTMDTLQEDRGHDYDNEERNGQHNLYYNNMDLSERDGITSVQEATEMIVDYASFIWDIAAQRTPAPASHEIMVLAISSLWLMLFTLVVFGQYTLDNATRTLIIGVSVNFNLMFFYAAPLSKIATVLETRSSKLIHIPTMITSLLNGMLWFVYGLEVSDPFIAVPNGFGAALGVAQVFLCLIFPRHHCKYTHDTSGDGMIRVQSSASLSLPEESTPLI